MQARGCKCDAMRKRYAIRYLRGSGASDVDRRAKKTEASSFNCAWQWSLGEDDDAIRESVASAVSEVESNSRAHRSGD
jgi:hypothetical protein